MNKEFCTSSLSSLALAGGLAAAALVGCSSDQESDPRPSTTTIETEEPLELQEPICASPLERAAEDPESSTSHEQADNKTRFLEVANTIHTDSFMELMRPGMEISTRSLNKAEDGVADVTRGVTTVSIKTESPNNVPSECWYTFTTLGKLAPNNDKLVNDTVTELEVQVDERKNGDFRTSCLVVYKIDGAENLFVDFECVDENGEVVEQHITNLSDEPGYEQAGEEDFDQISRVIETIRGQALDGVPAAN